MPIHIRWPQFMVTMSRVTTGVRAKALTLAGSVISLAPSRTEIIKAGALLPPLFRNGLVLRLLSAIAMQCKDLPSCTCTNLGIRRKLHVKIPSSKLTLLFGKPSLFTEERASLDLAIALFRQASCFIDVGSNDGLYVFYVRCRHRSDKPIYFLEPDPKLFERLKLNIGANDLKGITGYQLTLAATSGKTVLVRIRPDDNSGGLNNDDWSHTVLEPFEVERISFADFIAGHSLQHVCARIDAKGNEDGFLDGAKPALDKLDYLIMEISDRAMKHGFPSRIAREVNLHAYYINDYRLEHSLFGEYRYRKPFHKWLFCVESPTSLRTKLKGTRFHVADASENAAATNFLTTNE